MEASTATLTSTTSELLPPATSSPKVIYSMNHVLDTWLWLQSLPTWRHLAGSAMVACGRTFLCLCLRMCMCISRVDVTFAFVNYATSVH